MTSKQRNIRMLKMKKEPSVPFNERKNSGCELKLVLSITYCVKQV